MVMFTVAIADIIYMVGYLFPHIKGNMVNWSMLMVRG